jgi:gas vesicle protein
MDRRNEMIMGLALGVLVGGVASLILAPQSGRESREVLMEQIGRLKDRMKRDRGDQDWEEAVASSDVDYLH